MSRLTFFPTATTCLSTLKVPEGDLAMSESIASAVSEPMLPPASGSFLSTVLRSDPMLSPPLSLRS